jgi:MoaA/NifB/PqqE/SkfB family radical SAM enzyme
MTRKLGTIRLDLINACNERCTFCPYFGEGGSVVQNKKRLVPLTKLGIPLILENLRNLKASSIEPKIQISGEGEATLHPDFFNLVSGLSALGLKFRIITNGQILDRFKDVLISSGAEIVVSIHGRGSVHDEIVQKKGAYDIVRKNVSLFDPSSVIVALVICDSNVADLELIFDEWKAHAIRFSHNFLAHSTSPRFDVSSLWQRLQKLKEKSNVRIIPDMNADEMAAYYSTGFHVINPTHCDYFDGSITIRSDGKVINCQDTVLGDLRCESLAALVGGEKFASANFAIASNFESGQTHPSCDRCCYQVPSSKLVQIRSSK